MKTSEQVQSILIVEDHPDASRVLEQVCRETFHVSEISCCSTLAAARNLIRERRFDLTLLDVGLPDGNGIELIGDIKSAASGGRCVMTTIFDDDQHLFHALQAGADGYLVKGHSPQELSDFLLDAVAGKLALSANIAQSILGFFRNADDCNKATPERDDSLTARETEVLLLIAKGCQVKEVSHLLKISINTVSHHIKNIYSKLNVRNRAEATAAAVNLNLYNPR